MPGQEQYPRDKLQEVEEDQVFLIQTKKSRLPHQYSASKVASNRSSLGSSDRESSFDSVFDYEYGPAKSRGLQTCNKASTSSAKTTPLTNRKRLESQHRSSESTDSSLSGKDDKVDLGTKSSYRILILGASKVGKTSIIRQFLYDKFSLSYTETMDDMYRGEFEIHGRPVTFDIQDISGSYVYEFPGMKSVSIASADAYIIVFSMDSSESWEEAIRYRDMVIDEKGTVVPIVVVGNKSDLPYDDSILQESIEATVVFDWENGYVESSAKDRVNINKIFRELLQQAKSRYDFSPPQPVQATSGTFRRGGSQKTKQKVTYEENMRRRQSLPLAPPDLPKEDKDGADKQGTPKRGRSFKILKSRGTTLGIMRNDSCKVS